MAEATTISMSVPIFAVIFAALLLGEATGWQRWSAVIVGFVGVLVVLDPLASFAGGFGGPHGAGTLVALTGAIMTALITIAVREDRKTVVSGKSVSVRVDLGGRRIIKTK